MLSKPCLGTILNIESRKHSCTWSMRVVNNSKFHNVWQRFFFCVIGNPWSRQAVLSYILSFFLYARATQDFQSEQLWVSGRSILNSAYFFWDLEFCVLWCSVGMSSPSILQLYEHLLVKQRKKWKKEDFLFAQVTRASLSLAQ